MKTQLADTGFSRRDFLKAAGSAVALVAGGGLTLSTAATATDKRGGDVAMNAWLRIGHDDTVTILLSQSEMGQGIATTLPAALADELGADWARVRTEWSPFDPAYRHPQYGWMFTGNSESTSTFYPVMRTMGAAARTMLTQAAAKRWKADAASLTVSGSRVRNPATGHEFRFGELVDEAGKLPVPAKPQLKPDSELTLIGKSQARLDIPSKVDGSAVFGIDVNVPHMAVAAIRRAPSPEGTLVSYDADGLHARPGVIAVVEIPSGLAVVAEHYWTAKRALEEGKLVFASGKLADYSTAAQRSDHRARLAGGEFLSKKKSGDAAATLGAAKAVHEAVYEIPLQAHATMEPMNCTAYVTHERCELWAPTQGMEIAQAVAKDLTGLRDDQIVIHRTLLGGGFGRRLLGDFVRVAITVAKACDRPVKVIWSREEDITYDAFRPPMTHAIRATLGADGQPVAMAHRVVSASHLLYVFPRTKLNVPFPWDRPIDPPRAYDGMAVEGVLETPYEIPHYSVEQNYVDTPLSVSVWRTTGHGPNNFALESFIDELAHAARIDPLVYRQTLAQKDPRALGVLSAVAEMSGWPRKRQPGVGCGIALAKAFNGYIAQVIEVGVKGAEIRTREVWTAMDCGQTLDPGIAASNTEGGIVWGLSALRTEITFANGLPEQRNFNGFDPLHLWETPVMHTRFVESGARIGGTGELGPVPTHAAFCNAVFAASGKRIRALPLSRENLRLV